MEQNREHRNKPMHLQSIYDKGGNNIQWRKDSLFNKWYWESWTVTCKTMKLGHSLTPYTKTSSKWFKDLKVRHGTIKLLKESMSEALVDINCSNIFLDQSPKAKEMKEK